MLQVFSLTLALPLTEDPIFAGPLWRVQSKQNKRQKLKQRQRPTFKGAVAKTHNQQRQRPRLTKQRSKRKQQQRPRRMKQWSKRKQQQQPRRTKQWLKRKQRQRPFSKGAVEQGKPVPIMVKTKSIMDTARTMETTMTTKKNTSNLQG